jgi:hypothetical protein
MRALLPARTTSHPTLSNHDCCTGVGTVVMDSVHASTVEALAAADASMTNVTEDEELAEVSLCGIEQDGMK